MSKPTHPACMIAQGRPDPALVRCRGCRQIPSACDAARKTTESDCCPACSHGPTEDAAYYRNWQ